MTIILQVSVALSFLLYLCYIRLFRRFYDINLICDNITELLYIFITLFVITLSLTIVFGGTIFLKSSNLKANKINIVLKVLTIPFNYVTNSQITLYTKIFDFCGPLVQQYLVLFAKKFLENILIRRVLYLGIILPRMIIIIILILELYLGHLKYYYYALLLLIIPIMVQFLVFILKDIGPRLYPVFSDHLIFTKVATAPNKNGDLFFIKMTLKPEYSFMNLDSFMHELYYPMLYLPGTLDVDFLPKYNNLRQYTLFTYYFIQTLCWGYVLIIYFL